MFIVAAQFDGITKLFLEEEILGELCYLAHDFTPGYTLNRR